MSNENKPVQQEEEKTIISIIVAAAANNAIGKDNQLLWHLPADMKFFKNTTWSFPVIMGRKTFEALGKPLGGRFNVVISTNRDFRADGAVVVSDLSAAIEAAAIMKTKEIFIIGGGQIYEQSMGVADRIYMTRVHTEMDADTYFPTIDKNVWHIVSTNSFPSDAKHAYDYTFEIWERK